MSENNIPYPIWSGSISYSDIPQLTTFKFYDNDPLFISESVASIHWAARRLGFPVTDIELTNEIFVSMFEEAVTEYSARVNEQNIKEYMLTLQGNPRNIDLTGRLVRGGIGRIISLANSYGGEIGVGGDIDWKRTYIEIEPNKQVYDLNQIFLDNNITSERIEIKRIFHDAIPASVRYYAPLGIEGANAVIGADAALGYFGGIGSYAVTYLLRPLYEDLLRMQAVEFNDQIRKSAYSFELINNKLRLFPIPKRNFKLWIDYIIKKDSEIGFVSGSFAGNDIGLNRITDQANIPYNNIPYSTINSVGRKWIRDYFLALCKISLGAIRSKYPQIPIPEGTISLDGETLRNEGIAERDKLIERLIDMLEKSGKKMQIQNKQEEEEHIQKILSSIPLGIYIK